MTRQGFDLVVTVLAVVLTAAAVIIWAAPTRGYRMEPIPTYSHAYKMDKTNG